MGSGIEGLGKCIGCATAVKQTGVAVGSIADLGHSILDLMCSAPQRSVPSPSDKHIRPEVSILGLGDEDFPPIRPLSDSVKGNSGKSRDASKSVNPSVKTRANSKAIQEDASLSSVPTRSQPVRLGSRTVKGVLGKGRGVTAVVLLSEDAKDSHNWRSLFVNHPKSCSSLVFSNPARVDRKEIINPPEEAVVEGVGIWEGCLVGQFFDKRLPLHVVRSLVERL